ncbi:CdaR family transcriptional regulator [Oceanobacillus alkalisoli]|uniref:CdaR family transcriptional regulator n=1 Tax=Oceanobacillus alkalisoli TaxID=2925113 RepID=UPI001EE3B9F3|nr:sugar diacid recognition domain-containing protein [Oceanobacillus alkalisoli]MCG5105013.1 helix-turn-helix domain-containing protein [Oceanobacillus alkalisoli]
MLTRDIANSIVNETSLRIKRNVNIMDTDGKIIASMDDSRIDTVHKGAKEVIQTGESIHIYSVQDKDWEGAQPGINLPIVFQDKVIGVIGITGDPNKMGNIGELVKMTTELMINQEFIASQLEWKQRMKEMVIEQLLKEHPSFSKVERGISLLELDFTPPFLGIVIEFDRQIFQRQAIIRRVETLLGVDKTIAGFISIHKLHIAMCQINEKLLTRKMKDLHELMQRLSLSGRISYSLPFIHQLEFHQAYVDCNLALRVSDRSIVSFANIEVEGLIHELDDRLSKRFAKRVLQNISETKQMNLQFFLDHNLNILKAADALFLHRNTLIYRLNKIQEETGYDPRIFHDALVLQFALWIFKYREQERNE